MELQGKTALVTGGAKRIGRAIALGFAKEGCNILLHYHTSKHEAQSLRDEIVSIGTSCDIAQCDFTDIKATQIWIQKNHELLNKVSILINSASIYAPDADPDSLLSIHYHVPKLLSQYMGSQIKRSQSEGVIVNITDAMLKRPSEKLMDYFASKNALDHLTRTLALELGPEVRVNSVAPGCILFPEGYSDEQKKKILDKIPVRKQGSPDDIATACVFLAKSDYINATTLVVDGGRSL